MVEAIFERLPLLTCETSDIGHQWKQIANQIGREELEVRRRWSSLARYARKRTRDEAAGKVFKNRPSKLFKLIVKIVKTMDEANEAQKQDRLDGRFLTILAMEVKSFPTLWDPSCEGVVTEKESEGWGIIAENLQLDVPTVLDYWSRLMRMYETHREREKQAAERIPYKESLTRVMTILQGMLEPDEPGKLEPRDRKSSARKRKDIERPKKKVQIDENLKMAEQFLSYEHLWNKQHPDKQKRKEAYEAIAAHLGITRTKVVREWERLRSLYRGVKLRNDHGSANNRLLPLLQQLFTGNKAEVGVSCVDSTGSEQRVVSENVQPTNDERLQCQENCLTSVTPILQGVLEPDEPGKLESSNQKSRTRIDFQRPQAKIQMNQNLTMVKQFLSYELFWNKQHPHKQNAKKRKEANEAIAAHLGITRTEVVREWERLRSLYRGAKRRNDHGSANDPLYPLLHQLFTGSKVEVGVSCVDSTGSEQRVVPENVQPTNDERLPCKENCLTSITPILQGVLEPEEPGKLESSNQKSRTRIDLQRPQARIQMNQNLTMVKQFLSYELFWNKQHPHKQNAKKRKEANEAIAAHLGITRTEVVREWERLRSLYRGAKRRNDHGSANDPLYPLLHQLFTGSKVEVDVSCVDSTGVVPENIQPTNDERLQCKESLTSVTPILQGVLEPDEPGKLESRNQKSRTRIDFQRPQARIQMNQNLTMLKQFLSYELFWNKQHPHKSNASKRKEANEAIAAHLGITRTEVVREWERLRSLYRGAKRRNDHGSANDPLYPLLHQLFTGSKAEVDVSCVDSTESENAPENVSSTLAFQGTALRTRMAEELLKLEVLWNAQHPHYESAKKRGQAWRELAAVLGTDTKTICLVWNRTIRRSREYRAKHGKPDANRIATDPLQELLDKTMPEKLGLATQGVEWPSLRRSDGPRKKIGSDGSRKTFYKGTIRYLKVCEVCGKSIERSVFEYHMNEHNGLKPYACSFEGCDQKYSSKITLDRHKVFHDKSGFKHKCDECGMKFKEWSKLDYHFAMRHKSQEIPCNICGRIQRHSRALHVHMKFHRASCSCNVCGRVFPKKYTLKEHMRIHTQEKPYPCELCDQRFRIKVLLKTHLSKVHGVRIQDLETARAADASLGSGLT